jgi:hypothetical protein
MNSGYVSAKLKTSARRRLVNSLNLAGLAAGVKKKAFSCQRLHNSSGKDKNCSFTLFTPAL